MGYVYCYLKSLKAFRFTFGANGICNKFPRLETCAWKTNSTHQCINLTLKYAFVYGFTVGMWPSIE